MTIQQMLLAGGPVVYAVWDPLNKTSAVTLSNANLTATISGAVGIVFTTIGNRAGKKYWELTATTTGTGTGIFVGVTLNSQAIAGPSYVLGDGTFDASYNKTGSKIIAGASSAFGTAISNGDIVGFAHDYAAGTVNVYLNNVLQGTIRTYSANSIINAGVSNDISASTIVVTANFGQSAMTYTPPTGYVAGLYS